MGAEPGASLVYALETSASAPELHATFAHGRITVLVPDSTAQRIARWLFILLALAAIATPIVMSIL